MVGRALAGALPKPLVGSIHAVYVKQSSWGKAIESSVPYSSSPDRVSVSPTLLRTIVVLLWLIHSRLGVANAGVLLVGGLRRGCRRSTT
ncbi:unnamed protein product [Urochloa humidicola]